MERLAKRLEVADRQDRNLIQELRRRSPDISGRVLESRRRRLEVAFRQSFLARTEAAAGRTVFRKSHGTQAARKNNENRRVHGELADAPAEFGGVVQPTETTQTIWVLQLDLRLARQPGGLGFNRCSALYASLCANFDDPYCCVAATRLWHNIRHLLNHDEEVSNNEWMEARGGGGLSQAHVKHMSSIQSDKARLVIQRLEQQLRNCCAQGDDLHTFLEAAVSLCHQASQALPGVGLKTLMVAALEDLGIPVRPVFS